MRTLFLKTPFPELISINRVTPFTSALPNGRFLSGIHSPSTSHLILNTTVFGMKIPTPFHFITHTHTYTHTHTQWSHLSFHFLPKLLSSKRFISDPLSFPMKVRNAGNYQGPIFRYLKCGKQFDLLQIDEVFFLLFILLHYILHAEMVILNSNFWALVKSSGRAFKRCACSH